MNEEFETWCAFTNARESLTVAEYHLRSVGAMHSNAGRKLRDAQMAIGKGLAELDHAEGEA